MQTNKQPTLEELAKQAEEAMADLARTFPAMATGDVQTMKQLLVEAMSTFKEDRIDIIKTKLYRKAHDLKGQGATFGYPLITDIGAHMCQLITSKKTYTPSDIQAIKQDIQMMETVLWKKLKGDGGPKGTEILQKLRAKK